MGGLTRIGTDDTDLSAGNGKDMGKGNAIATADPYGMTNKKAGNGDGKVDGKM